MAEPWESLLRNLRSIMKDRSAICVLPCLLSKTAPLARTGRNGRRAAVGLFRTERPLPAHLSRSGAGTKRRICSAT